MKRTRVLVLAPDFPPAFGGIQLLVHRVVSYWQDLQALILTTAEGSEGADPGLAASVRRVNTSYTRSRPGKVALLSARAITEARRFRPQVVLSSHIVMSPAAWAIARLTGAPYIQYLHGREVTSRPRLADFALRHSAAAIAVSDYTASLVASGLGRTRMHRIPPGVDAPGPRRQDQSPQPVILTVSRMSEPSKGHDVMLRALPLVRARLPQVQWVVIGDGPLRPRYERMALAFGVSDQVRFVGALQDDKRDAWFDAAHLFAMPSRLSSTGGGEGFGIVYLEAAAHSLPVVAGNVGGALEAVIDGVTGLLVDPTDHLAVAEAITDLLLDRERAQALGRAGAGRVPDFSWPAVSKRVEQIVMEVAAARAA